MPASRVRCEFNVHSIQVAVPVGSSTLFNVGVWGVTGSLYSIEAVYTVAWIVTRALVCVCGVAAVVLSHAHVQPNNFQTPVSRTVYPNHYHYYIYDHLHKVCAGSVDK